MLFACQDGKLEQRKKIQIKNGTATEYELLLGI